MKVESGKFACDACGKRYAWKPQLAGKKAKWIVSHLAGFVMNLIVLGLIGALTAAAAARSAPTAAGRSCSSPTTLSLAPSASKLPLFISLDKPTGRARTR